MSISSNNLYKFISIREPSEDNLINHGNNVRVSMFLESLQRFEFGQTVREVNTYRIEF